MATIVYRRNEAGDLETDRVEAKRLQATLANGWHLRDPLLDVKEEPEHTLEELREMAAEAGIEGADTMRSPKLRRALGL